MEGYVASFQQLAAQGQQIANTTANLGTPLKAANWAVGGFITGATVGFERCQYLRRLERLSMKRIVEVHQSDVEEKKRIKEEEERKRAEAEAAERAKKAWYKFW